MFDLTGKTALVTGASGGIGKAVATNLHAAGATVGLTGTRTQVLDDLAASLGGSAHAIVCDLSDAAAVDGLIGRAADAMGQVDILINNAGITRDNLAMRMKDEDWQAVLDVNLTAAFKLARAVLKSMMRQRWGRIISITSVVGTTGNPGQVNYAAAKAGLVGFSKSLAQEVASRNITVNCVAPGFIETAMTDALNDDQRARILQNVPAGRLGTADEVASACRYLASAEASYVTGHTLHVNGGLAMI
jgi:3-oxoacyl-[acyl-carrier protein] reductase